MAVTVSRPQGVNAKITIQKKLVRVCRSFCMLSFGHENECKNTEKRRTESQKKNSKYERD